MAILTKSELHLRKKEIIDKIRQGAIFIHPTDTIYGLGCNASNEAAVRKIRKIKNRHDTPFSIWVPHPDWIKQNCHSSAGLNKWLKQLPGAYTLIVKIKNKNIVAPNINPKKNTIGLRIPDHWFHKIIEDAGVPIITTSANKTGSSFMTSLEDLDPDIKRNVDFIIYEGEKKARPSKVINLIEEEKIIER